MSKHTLSVLVENSPGVLARVSGLFSRRGYNIDSLAVGPTENPLISRMTIVINVEGHPLEQVIRQLDKLVNVIHIAEVIDNKSVQAELLMVKISATPKNRFDVEAVVETYEAKIVDEDATSITIEATGDTAKIADLLSALERFGIRELVQSGLIALERGSVTLSERTLSSSGIPVADGVQADYQN
jgi:acetolactate synthase I/III small subunit